LLPLGPAEAKVLASANFGFGLLLVTLGIGIFYRFGPNRPKNRYTPRFLTLGLLVAIVLWGAVSRGLVYYLSNFPSYNQVYGSIGAVVALMFWFYISAYAVLLGAAVDAERAASAREARGEPPVNPS
jgi:membrane protein